MPTLPWPRVRASPRAKAAATASPTAAETKFCTASPDIWIRWPAAASPEYHCQLVLVTNETAVFHAPSLGNASLPPSSGNRFCRRPNANSSRIPAREKPRADIA